SDKSRIIWVQLAKIKNNEKIKASISKELRDWAEFFSDPNAIESSDEGMKDAQKLWNRISANDQLKAQQRAQDKYQRDKDSEIAIAKEEGLTEGLEKGKHNAKIETAKNLLAMGLSIEQISIATGLTVDKIQGLM
ncbi:MAG: Rpn family recombination-promoting nuclease/putative transposase, partial [Alphaproteobacteria bacterium]|nr:Rpn family recombination-promoting nuclease/putative transposase [Alphaproteobacteria bacterium]